MSSIVLSPQSNITRTELQPDTIMIREALAANSSRGPTNITVFWPLKVSKGAISIDLCKTTIKELTNLHPNLQTSFYVNDRSVHWFKLHPVNVPLTIYESDDPLIEWKDIVKNELRKPFNDIDKPSWRVAVSHSKDNTLFVAITILHALGDGVCLGQLAVQFNEIMANLILGKKPSLKLENKSFPLEKLFQKYPQMPLTKSLDLPPLPYYPSDTGFAKHPFLKSDTLVQNLRSYCKKHEIKIHSTLVAALVLAMKKIKNPQFETFQALTIVSFRDALETPKSEVRPLFSWLRVDNVNPNESFLNIAKYIHHNLHAQLKSGAHVANIKTTEQDLLRKPTAEEFVSRLRLSKNLINLTNRQELGSSGKYPEREKEPILTMPEIYGVGGNTPYFGVQGPGGIGITVGVTTFNDRFYTTASVLEDESVGIGEKMAEEILIEMENLLLKEAPNIS